MLLFRLRKDEITQRVAIQQFHNNVHVQFVSKRVVVLDDVWMVEVFENGNFFANLLDYGIVYTLLGFSCLLVLCGEVLLKLLWGHIEVDQGYFFHSVLVFSPLHQVHGAVSTFADQVEDLKPIYVFIFVLTSELLKIAHIFKVLPYLV